MPIIGRVARQLDYPAALREGTPCPASIEAAVKAAAFCLSRSAGKPSGPFRILPGFADFVLDRFRAAVGGFDIAVKPPQLVAEDVEVVAHRLLRRPGFRPNG